MASTGTQAFTAADGTNITTLGWTVDAGAFQVTSNACAENSSAAEGRARYTTTAMDSANHEVQASCTRGTGSVRDVAITGRQASSTATFYMARYQGPWSGGDGWALVKCVSGSFTDLDAEEPGATAATVALVLTLNGSSLSATLDGAKTQSATDSAITSGTYAGIWGGWNCRSIWDNWSAADLAAGGPTMPVFEQYYRRLRMA